MRFGRNAFVVCGLLATVIVIVLWMTYRNRNAEISLEQARRELRLGYPESALEMALGYLSRNPGDRGAIRVAAMAHAALGQPLEAAALFLTLPDGSLSARDTLLPAAQKALDQGKLSEGALLLRKCVDLFPSDTPSHRLLASILSSGGQRWDSRPHGLDCVRQKQFSLTELLLIGNPEEPFDDQKLLPTAAKMSPEDPLVMSGLAVAAVRSNEMDKALRLLEKATVAAPELMESRASLGGLLLDNSDFPKLIDWRNALPANATDHSEIWYVWGRWAQTTQQYEAAARCYWESTLRAPESRKANFQLGQMLSQLNRSQEAERFLQRAEQLAELHQLMRPIYFGGPKTESLIRIAQLMESVGRTDEAIAWYFAVTRFSPEERIAAESLTRLEASLESRPVETTVTAFNPAASLDLSDLPLPKWDLPSEFASPLTQRAESSWFFRDTAASAGIHFQYFNSDDPRTEGKRMFETTGGGVAVADFDNNGWPDIYLTQGCRWPVDETQREFADHCYLNTGRGTFLECSIPSKLLEYGFSQGVSAGDFDNDGFVDLYIANIGRNQLFRNNGDGTFDPVAIESGVIDQSWTTSCVIADLDADGFPDLFDVNYLSGKEAFETICGTDHPRTCSPATFSGTTQQFCRNSGDGTWKNMTNEVGIMNLSGKGLGLVVARLTESPVPEVLIANDGIANFFLRASNGEENEALQYQETAILSGLAFDREGLSQACMGIAVEDFNADSRLDFLVTNYYEESNTLYVQKPGLLFADETREAGLRSPSLLMLGFGTQSLDADLDGFPDLIVANGHVDDFSYDGKAFHMRPQYFHNAGDGRFHERITDRKDSWFSGEYLGRGLARVDWNRDGREDFVVSHLDSPAALVTNESADCGNSLTIRLIGVKCSRDAVGTNVTVTSAGRSRTRQLTAGDGYQASNERMLVFGLADAETAEDVLIQWPSGTEQSLSNLAAGFEYRVIEGRSQAIKIPLESAVRE